MTPIRRFLSTLLVAGTLPVFGQAASVEFARDIQPLFAERCQKCHGAEKQKGGLRLDNPADAFKAAESGDFAIVPGHSAQSALMKVVTSTDKDERMPPKGEALSAAQIALLKQWIDDGATWPASLADSVAVGRKELAVTDEDRKHWSYLPLNQRLSPPDMPSAENPIDRFIHAALQAKGIRPSQPLERRKLIRRVYFDLLGLPPKPEEIDDFVADPDPDAYKKLVDRLLASPYYGERWGRHWLDVARYADSDGQESDQDRPNAYHYRDFVIRAFNDDLPYDRFVRWQIAGGELAPDDPQAIAATGFIVAGVHTELNVPMEEEKIRNRFNELDDMLSTTGAAFLGLTVACARCHDHKYDAIPTRDYYRMLSAFNSGDQAEVPLASRAEVQAYQEAEKKWKAACEVLRSRLADWLGTEKEPLRKSLREAKIDSLPIDDASKTLLKTEPDLAPAKELRAKHEKALQLTDDDFRNAFSAGQVARWDALSKELKALEAKKPAALPTTLAMADFAAEPRPTWLFDRGNFSVKREAVQLGFLTVLSRDRTAQDYLAAAKAEGPIEKSTYQRKAMAEWITDLEHGAGALLARVMVNRVWQHHFGEGLVRTVNNFGVQGETPTNPELFEWLTAEFVRGDWKLKPLHRLIMTSSAYMQETTFAAEKAALDPDDRLLWRRRPLRIEAEILRDSILATSGQLNGRLFGPAFKAPIESEAIQARNVKDPYPKDVKDTPETHRRSIYMFHKRVVQHPMMQVFDGPDASVSCGRRINTTVAPQALALLNDRFVRARAADFATRLAAEAGSDIQACVERAYQLALGRHPTPPELAASAQFIEAQNARRRERDKLASAAASREAVTDYCQALFNLNEFLYVD